MTPQERINAIAERPKNRFDLIRAQLLDKRVYEEIAYLLQDRIRPEAYIRVLLTTIMGDPKLMACTAKSIIQAAFSAAGLGLLVNGSLGHAYLVPYRKRKEGITIAQLQIGYKGYVDLAYRSNRIAYISAEAICVNDEFDYSEGTDRFLKHKKPQESDRGDLIGSFSLAETVLHAKNGVTTISKDFRVLTKDDVLKRKASAKFSDDKDSPWQQWPHEMWRKTAIRSHASTLPQCPDLQRAASEDSAREAGEIIIPAIRDQSLIDELSNEPQDIQPTDPELLEFGNGRDPDQTGREE